jgi:MFS family permease
MQLLLSGIINCTQLVGVVTSLWTMDRFGRRPLLLVGAALMFICHLIIAVLVGKFGGRWASFAVEGWVAVAFLFFYMFSFGATWGPVPWAMPSEIFPSSLRAKGVALLVPLHLPTSMTYTNGLRTDLLAPTGSTISSSDWLRRHLSRTPAPAHTCSSPSFVPSLLYLHSSSFLRLRASRWRTWMRCLGTLVVKLKSRRRKGLWPI